MVSSLFTEKKFKHPIQDNDILYDVCKRNNSHFISNGTIISDDLRIDDLHWANNKTYKFTNNFAHFLTIIFLVTVFDGYCQFLLIKLQVDFRLF